MLSRVSGSVVMSVKHETYVGETLLSVDVLDEQLQPTGQTILAIDKAQAGIGDLVLVLREGSGIRQIIGRESQIELAEAIQRDVPIRSLIVAVVDDVQVAS